MPPKFLLDTHILIRWRADPKRLSRDQTRIPDAAVGRREAVGISAITLLELALLNENGFRTKLSRAELFEEIENHPVFRILPLTIEIAKDVILLERLRDPADRVIVATARTHGLRLLTSDVRIIESNLVLTVE